MRILDGYETMGMQGDEAGEQVTREGFIPKIRTLEQNSLMIFTELCSTGMSTDL